MTCTRKCQNKNYLTQWSCHHYFKKYHGQVFKIKRWIFFDATKRRVGSMSFWQLIVLSIRLLHVLVIHVYLLYFSGEGTFISLDLPACLEGVNKYYYKLLLSRAIPSCSPLGKMPNNAVMWKLLYLCFITFIVLFVL